MDNEMLTRDRLQRVKALDKHGSIAAAVHAGDIPQFVDVTLSEALVLGLVNQGVRKYIGIFGHGSTDLGEVLRLYAGAGIRTFAVHHETMAAHAATTLYWQYGETAAIKIVCDFAAQIGAVKFFDAGDVQANGFQIVEDETPGFTYTDTGSSFMGFAVSSLLAGAMADKPAYAIALCGEGSFWMNPQILSDAVEYQVRGMIVIFDNRRMGAISGLQWAQYAEDHATNDSATVDYLQLTSAVSGVKAIDGGTCRSELDAALHEAHQHVGLSVVHVPVYCGQDELGDLGAWGEWNVGNWCEAVQREYQALGL